MGKQIVVSEGKVIAYGEDCFSVTNDTVICANTGNIYHNATVVNVDSLPEDIDRMCYKYDMGHFRCDVSRPRMYNIQRVEMPVSSQKIILNIPDFDACRHIVFFVRKVGSENGYFSYEWWNLLDVGEKYDMARYTSLLLHKNGDVEAIQTSQYATLEGRIIVIDALITNV